MSADRWRELLAQVESEEEVAVGDLEEAIRQADVAADVQAGFRLRSALIYTCQDRDRADLILTHYPWCTGHADCASDEERRLLLFRYRWAISQTREFPAIPRSQIEELIDDMSQRYAESGYSQRAVWVLKMHMGYHWRDHGLIEQAVGCYQAHPRDELADNEETEAVFAGHAMLEIAPREHARRLARLEIKSRAHRSPVKSSVLLPLLMLGEHELAREQHELGMQCATERWDFPDRSCHAVYRAMIREQESAEELLLRDLPAAVGSIEARRVVDYFANAAWVLSQANPAALLPLDRRRLQANTRQISPLHRAFPAGQGPSLDETLPQRLTRGALASWCRARSRWLAAQFDRHCRSNAYHTALDELDRLRPLS
ncbi:MAG: hypothetical protein KDB14_08045 [Planctomycetales bacterium]|nr:hypothetical protein [Planctomycetales bacterium]